MKYGKYLERNAKTDWKQHYIDYEALKKIVLQTAESLAAETTTGTSRTASLTVARAPDDALHQEFFTRLNAEVIRRGDDVDDGDG